MTEETLKGSVRAFWEEAPCGTRELSDTRDELAKFEQLDGQRYLREPFIPRFARFEDARGRDLLEIGVGAGSDHLRFARAGAMCSGIDLTEAAIGMTRRRLELEGLRSNLRIGDAEALPFEDASFDIAYSWGVIHHTPNTERAAREILRVLRPGGRFCVMVYNRRSLLAAQMWIGYAVLRGRPGRSIGEVLANHLESPGTKAYTAAEALALFEGAQTRRVETAITAYDMRWGRRRFLPVLTWRLVPSRFGWFHIVSGTR